MGDSETRFVIQRKPEDVAYEYVDDNKMIIHNARCSADETHIVTINIDLDHLDANLVGGCFFVPCSVCGNPVLVKDEYVMNAYDLSKDDVKLFRSKIANERRNREGDVSATPVTYNPQGDDSHAFVEKVKKVDDENVDVSDEYDGEEDDEDSDDNDSDSDIDDDSDSLSPVYIDNIPDKRSPIHEIHTNISSVDSTLGGVNEDALAKIIAKAMMMIEDKHINDTVFGNKNVRIISPEPEHEPETVTASNEDTMITKKPEPVQYPGMEQPETGFDEDKDPNDILKGVIRESKHIDDKLKEEICEHIDLQPGGWQPYFVATLLESYGISKSSASKVSKRYETILMREELKRKQREARLSLIGQPSSSVDLPMNQFTFSTSPVIGNAPNPAFVAQNAALSQKITDLASTVHDTTASLAITQLSGIVNQLSAATNTLATSNVGFAHEDMQQAIGQTHQMITQLVEYLEQMNNANQQISSGDIMALGQFIGQLQQQMNQIATHIQTAQNEVPMMGLSPRDQMSSRYDPASRYDPYGRVDRFEMLRRRRSRMVDDDDEEDDDDYDIRRTRKNKSKNTEEQVKNLISEEMKGFKDSMNSLVRMMMQQQYNQQVQQQPTIPNPINEEVKALREMLTMMVQGQDEQQQSESANELREMKELFVAFIQQQQNLQNENMKEREKSELNELKEMFTEYIRSQRDTQAAQNEKNNMQMLMEMIREMKPKNDNDRTTELILEMIKSQAAANTSRSSDEVREFREFIKDIYASNTTKGSVPDQRELQQQELFNKLFDKVMNSNTNDSKYDQMLGIIVSELRDLKKGNNPEQPTPRMTSIEELTHDLEMTKIRNEFAIKQDELNDKKENRVFIKEMASNAFKSIGESVGAIFASGLLSGGSPVGGASPSVPMQKQDVEPYVNEDGNIMAIQCQSCGNAIYFPVGATTVTCPCGMQYALDFGNGSGGQGTSTTQTPVSPPVTSQRTATVGSTPEARRPPVNLRRDVPTATAPTPKPTSNPTPKPVRETPVETVKPVESVDYEKVEKVEFNDVVFNKRGVAKPKPTIPIPEVEKAEVTKTEVKDAKKTKPKRKPPKVTKTTKTTKTTKKSDKVNPEAKSEVKPEVKPKSVTEAISDASVTPSESKMLNNE